MPHVLIIDDDRQNLAVLNELLALSQISCTALQDIQKLETIIEGLPPVDAVLLDLEMPGLNGYQILEILRNQAAFQGVPFVACTVHTNQVQNAEKAGFHSFISKPLDMDRFPQQMDLILHRTPVWDI